MVLNLDICYTLAIKSDVTLHTGREKQFWLYALRTMHYAGNSRSEGSFPLKRSVGNQTVGFQD